MKVRPKVSLAGLDGWVPIAEKNLPYEMTVSFLFTADKPGIPKPIKLQEQHRPFFDLGKEITEESGKKLAEWAAGGSPKTAVAPDPLAALVGELTDIVAELGAGPNAARIAEKLGQPGAKKWLEEQIRGGRARLAERSTAAGAGTPDGGSGAETSETEAVPAPEPAAVEEAAPLPDEPVDEFEPAPREGLLAAADVAGAVLVPRGTHTGTSIADMAENGKWLKWAIEHPDSWAGEETFYEGLKLFVRERVPDVWEKVEL
jgi:hypothetical protein